MIKKRVAFSLIVRLPFILWRRFANGSLARIMRYRYEYDGKINYQANILKDKTSNIQIGARSWIGAYSDIVLQDGTSLIMDDDTSIGRYCEIGGQGANIFIGSNSSIQDRCTIVGNIKIGRNCIFSKNVLMTSGKHHFENYPHLTQRDQDAIQEGQKVFEEPIVIEDDCFVGVGVHIKHGITLSKGTIVGANSVVTRDFPPYSVIGGVPAKLIKKRLEYSPSRKIDIYEEKTYPYFYSGMNMQRKYVSKNIQECGGVLVDGIFVLDMNIASASKIAIRMRKICPHGLFVVFNKSRVELANEMTEYEFDASRLETTKLKFEVVDFDGIHRKGCAALESAVVLD